MCMKEKNTLQLKVKNLIARNKSIKNKGLENRLALQNESLEKLERMALGLAKSKYLLNQTP